MADFRKPYPAHKGLGCTTAWHLRRSGLYLAVYDLIGKVTTGGENPYFVSIQRTAKYFHGENATKGQHEVMRRIFWGLGALGWLEKLPETEPSQHYRWIKHDEYAAAHPDKCNVRELLPWQIETDPLIGRLFAVAGGRMYAFENMLREAQRFASDEEIETQFAHEIAFAKAQREAGNYDNTSAKPRECFWRMIKKLRESKAAATVENPTYK